MNAFSSSTNVSWIETLHQQARVRRRTTGRSGEDAGHHALHGLVEIRHPSNTMFGDLPPSSIVTRFMCRAAFSLIMRPASGPPVKAMRSTRRMADERVADLGAVARHHVHDTRRETGGLDQLDEFEQRRRGELGRFQHYRVPAASAGASLRLVSGSGEFHGMMHTTTPTGSGLRCSSIRLACPTGMTAPSILSARPP